MFDKIVRSKILNFQSERVAFSAIILAFSTIASGLLGFLRDWLLSGRFGASSDLDAYFAAFRIPDFIYNVMVYGGITVAFLPIFASQYAKDKTQVWKFASNILTVFLAIMALIAGVCFLFAPGLVARVAPGFTGEQLAKTIFLTRIMFLSPLLFAASSVVSGILQYFNRFLVYGMAPLLYNLGIIAGIVIFTPFFGIAGVAYGVILGAALYLLVLLPPVANCGFKYRFIFKPFDPLLVKSFLLILPRFFAVAATQAELTFALFIASTLPVGSVTIFNFSSNIYLLPVSVVGLSFALASFPAFSKLYAESNLIELADKFSLTFRQVAFVVIPLSFLMWVLRDPIIGFIYLHGNFSATAALLMSATLAILCFGIFFYSEIHVMYRMFFALKDTLTPTLVTIASVFACVLLTFLFIGFTTKLLWAVFFTGLVAQAPLQGILKNLLNLNQVQDIRILGLALAFSISLILQFLLASFFLAKRNQHLIRAKEIGFSGAKSFLAGLVMALVIYILKDKIFTGLTSPFWNLAVYGIIGASLYVLLAYALGCQEIKTFKNIGANFMSRYQPKPISK